MSSRENRDTKARRLLVEGRVGVRYVGPLGVRASVRGDSAMIYPVTYEPGPDTWSCACPVRSRCSHIAAVMLVVLVGAPGIERRKEPPHERMDPTTRPALHGRIRGGKHEGAKHHAYSPRTGLPCLARHIAAPMRCGCNHSSESARQKACGTAQRSNTSLSSYARPDQASRRCRPSVERGAAPSPTRGASSAPPRGTPHPATPPDGYVVVDVPKSHRRAYRLRSRWVRPSTRWNKQRPLGMRVKLSDLRELHRHRDPHQQRTEREVTSAPTVP
jgi:hypothetical protein